jgi:hypothetical protein
MAAEPRYLMIIAKKEEGQATEPDHQHISLLSTTPIKRIPAIIALSNRPLIMAALGWVSLFHYVAPLPQVNPGGGNLNGMVSISGLFK